jgi:type I restriction enzyme S subunit
LQRHWGLSKVSKHDSANTLRVDFPPDWKLTPLRAILKRKAEAVGINSDKHTLLSLTTRGVIVRDLSESKGKFPANFDTYKKVSVGDFIFCLFDIEETPRTVGVSEVEGMITGAYTIYEPKKGVDSLFIYRLLLYCDERKRLKYLYKGLRNTIPKSVFESLQIPIPEPQEQRAINKFINNFEKIIFDAINKNLRIVNLLVEKRRLLIDSYVMSGGHERADFRKTSINWLGSIPSDWHLIKMKHLFKEKTIKGFPSEQLLVASQKHGVVTKQQYGLRTVVAEKDLGNLKLVEVNDFVISLRSFQGGIETSHARGIISPAYTVLQLVDHRYHEYFTYLLKSTTFIEALKLSVTGIREGQNIDYKRLGNEFIPLPPVEEAIAIGSKLTQSLKDINLAIKQVEGLIALLKECHESVFEEVITGKRRVEDISDLLEDNLEGELTFAKQGLIAGIEVEGSENE